MFTVNKWNVVIYCTTSKVIYKNTLDVYVLYGSKGIKRAQEANSGAYLGEI